MTKPDIEPLFCNNCQKTIKAGEHTCQFCGYPQHGTKAEKIAYNSKVSRVRDLKEDAAKSVLGIQSFGIIFLFMALVVTAFSFVFHENHLYHAILLSVAGIVYLLLSRLGRSNTYLMSSLALVFYLAHTIFEFSNQMYIKSPLGLSKSFSEGLVSSFMYVLVPMAYIIVRLVFAVVLAKYYWLSRKLKKYGDIGRFLQSK